MRIALEISGAFAGGGYRRLAENTLRALAESPAKHEYLLYAAFWKDFPRRAHALNVPKQPNFQWALRRLPQRFLLPAEEWLGLRYQERVLKGLGVDLVHGLCNIIPRVSSIPSVVTLCFAGHWDVEGFWDNFYFHRLTERSMREADRIISISDYALEGGLQYWAGLDRAKMRRVYPGPSSDYFRRADREEDPMPGVRRPYFLHVGDVRLSKNTLLLTRGFLRFRRDNPDLAHRLVLAGAWKDEIDAVRAAVKDAGMEAEVVLTGLVDQEKVSRLYQQAFAVLCASPAEGFGFPAVEAMSCGVPVVAAKLACLPEVVGEGGLHCEASPESLAAGMTRLCRDPGLRQRLAESASRWVARYDWKETARQTLAVYDELIASRRAGARGRNGA